MRIANPIYDAVFKYLMQDLNAAQALIGGILSKTVEVIAILPQESVHTHETEIGALSVSHFDYRAHIHEADGTSKQVLIELQKIHHKTNVVRFRRYLAESYKDPIIVNDEALHLPIVSIYLLGFGLSLCHPVIRVGRQYTDARTGKTVEGVDEFIEKLSHDAYFIQIPRLSKEIQVDIDRVLGVFSQDWQHSEGDRFLDVPDGVSRELDNSLLKRLNLATLDKEVQRQTIAQAEFELNFEDAEARGIEKGIALATQKALAEKQASARNLLTMGLSVAQIAQAIGLSEAEITAL